MRTILKLLTTVVVAGLAVTSVLLMGCGQQTAGGASRESAVTAELGEYYIRLDTDTVPAGKINFTVSNVGKMEHELIVLKTDLPVDKLPPEKDDPTRVDEDAIGTSGEVEEIGPGRTKTGTFELGAGKYVLICNKPGHYQAGQRIAFRVT